jgi:acyl carrier protein
MKDEQRSTDPLGAEAPVDLGVLRAVRQALSRVEPSLARTRIDLATSVIEDLGLDSIRFVDLTFALEDTLGIAEFPMQAWADAEATRPGRRFTVASLVDRCVACLREQSAGAASPTP